MCLRLCTLHLLCWAHSVQCTGWTAWYGGTMQALEGLPGIQAPTCALRGEKKPTSVLSIAHHHIISPAISQHPILTYLRKSQAPEHVRTHLRGVHDASCILCCVVHLRGYRESRRLRVYFEGRSRSLPFIQEPISTASVKHYRILAHLRGLHPLLCA